MDPVIPLADLQPIYSVADVDRALEDSAAKRNDGLKGWYDRMRELGGSRGWEKAEERRVGGERGCGLGEGRAAHA